MSIPESYEAIEEQYNFHANKLVDIVKATGELIEGNVFTHHTRYDIYEPGRTRRLNLFTVSRNARHILEIGFNAGHSALVFLLANPTSVLSSFDICWHVYVKPCVEYLQSVFGKDRLTLYEGNSLVTVLSTELPSSPDVYHIDGCHFKHEATYDMKNCYDRAKTGDVFILDDTNIPYLQGLWDTYLLDKKILKYTSSPLVEPIDCRHEIGIVQKYKVAVCTLVIGEDYKDWVKIGVKSLQRYCIKNGYDLINDESVYDPNRRIYWAKVTLLMNIIKSGKYDYVVWIDADTLIMNSNILLEDLIKTHMNGIQILMCQDNGLQYNTGVWFFKSTDYSLEILRLIDAQEPDLKEDKYPEQTAFSNLHNNNTLNLRNNSAVMSNYYQHIFNSAMYNYKNNGLLIHFLGIHKREWMLEVMHNHNPERNDGENSWGYTVRMNWLKNKYPDYKKTYKIGVCSLSIGDGYREKIKLGRETKIRYCQKHKYTFIEDASVYDTNRPIAWSKILLLKKYLKYYDYLVWIDADTNIMNDEIKLEDLIDTYSGNRDILVSRDISGEINTGVMFVKNTDFAHRVLDLVYAQEQFINDKYWEQTAFNYIYNNNLENIGEFSIALGMDQQHLFNCCVGLYKEGVFLIHFYGPRDINWVEKAMNDFCPFQRDGESDDIFNARLKWIRNR